MEDQHFTERYHRQLILEGFGMAVQKKLGQASVLVVGAGGLGCPVLSYLAAAGIGKIGVVDDGKVELSNLHRQVLYSVDDIGKPKVTCAARVLNRLNPSVDVVCYPTRLEPSNCLDILSAYDVVLDGLDNFEGKYMINDACALLSKPLIFAAITRFEGQVAVWNVASPGGKTNYRDLFPEQPYRDETMSCSEAGVLGILPGIIGSFQANECIKLLSGLGEPLANKLLTYNALTNLSYIIEVTPAPQGAALIPLDAAQFRARNYALGCRPGAEMLEIDTERFWELIKKEDTDLVDVREPGERPLLHDPDPLRIPLSQLAGRLSEIKKDNVIFVCQGGTRSLVAARQYRALQKGTRQIYSLSGGVDKLTGSFDKTERHRLL